MPQKFHTIEEIQKGYDAWSGSYDQVLVSQWKYRAPIEVANKLAPLLRPGMTLLDVACGTGLNSEQYPDQKITGVDFAEGMIREYEKKGFTGSLADIRKLPFADDTFDAAVCTAALENYKDPSTIIAEMSRVVRPQGLISFTVCVSPMDGCHTSSKSEVEQILLALNLRSLESFQFLSHYEYAKQERPIHYLGMVCLNTK